MGDVYLGRELSFGDVLRAGLSRMFPLFTYVIFGQWIFFALTAGAVIILRRKRPDLPRPYRVFGFPATPIIFIFSALFISLNTLINEFWNALAGLIIISVGLPAYLYWKRKASRGSSR